MMRPFLFCDAASALWPMRAGFLRAIAIERQRVLLQRKAARTCNALLALFDLGNEKF